MFQYKQHIFSWHHRIGVVHSFDNCKCSWPSWVQPFMELDALARLVWRNYADLSFDEFVIKLGYGSPE